MSYKCKLNNVITQSLFFSEKV